MGEVQVGDQLMGADGKPARVVAATGIMHGRPCYEVEFSDGEVVVADESHQWLTWTRRARRYDGQVRGCRKEFSASVLPEVVTTADIRRTLRCPGAEGRPNHAVPMTAPLELPESDLPVPPYALGVWLGDGFSSGARFTSADPEVAEQVAASGVAVIAERTDLRYRMAFQSTLVTPKVRVCAVCGTPFTPKTARSAPVAGRAAVRPASVPRPFRRRSAHAVAVRRLVSFRAPACASGAGKSPALCKRRSARLEFWAASTFRLDICGPRSRSGGPCSRGFLTPTAR